MKNKKMRLPPKRYPAISNDNNDQNDNDSKNFPCRGLKKRDCKQRQENCSWIETSRGQKFCRGKPGSTFPLSRSVFLSEKTKGQERLKRGEKKSMNQFKDTKKLDEYLFGPSGRWNNYRWKRLPDQIKNQLFSAKGRRVFRDRSEEVCAQIKNHEKYQNCLDQVQNKLMKYCRCTIGQSTGQMARHGTPQTKTWAICGNSIGRITKEEKKNPQAQILNEIDLSQLRSVMTKTARNGDCTTFLNLNNIPTSMLYGMIMERIKNSRGKKVFDQRIPSPREFLKNKESYRPLLIQLINHYRD